MTDEGAADWQEPGLRQGMSSSWEDGCNTRGAEGASLTRKKTPAPEDHLYHQRIG